jgi:low affinity Fe/Cu permease
VGCTVNRWFARFAGAAGVWTGHPLAFVLSLAAVVVWALSGPLFGFSDTWQLVINTGTTVLTFLLVLETATDEELAAVKADLDRLARRSPD